MINKIRTLAVVFTFALVTVAFAQQSASSAHLPSEDTVKAFLHQMFGYDPSITYRVVSIKPAEAPGFSEVTAVLNNGHGEQTLNFFVSPDQKFALVGQMLDFGADPFQRYRDALAHVDGPIRGPRNAKVTIVEFADLECPACKAALPNVEKIQAEDPNVRVIFANFPLERVHPWALRAALYLDCLKSNGDSAWKFIDTVYAHQEEINETNADELLKKDALAAGADPAKIAACIADPKTHTDVENSVSLGEQLGVTATPTIFVNGRKISSFNSLPYETFKQLVDFAAQESK